MPAGTRDQGHCKRIIQNQTGLQAAELIMMDPGNFGELHASQTGTHDASAQ